MSLPIDINHTRVLVDGVFIPGEPASLDGPAYPDRYEVHNVFSVSGDDLGGVFYERIPELEALALAAHLEDQKTARLQIEFTDKLLSV